MGYDPNTPYNQGQPQQPPYGQPAIPNTSPVYGQGQPPYQGPTQAYGQPPYGQGQYGGPPQNYTQAPQKKSRKWLWITLSIIGGVLYRQRILSGHQESRLQQGLFILGYKQINSSKWPTGNRTGVCGTSPIR